LYGGGAFLLTSVVLLTANSRPYAFNFAFKFAISETFS